jgi:hypothetical protein
MASGSDADLLVKVNGELHRMLDLLHILWPHNRKG